MRLEGGGYAVRVRPMGGGGFCDAAGQRALTQRRSMWVSRGRALFSSLSPSFLLAAANPLFHTALPDTSLPCFCFSPALLLPFLCYICWIVAGPNRSDRSGPGCGLLSSVVFFVF